MNSLAFIGLSSSFATAHCVSSGDEVVPTAIAVTGDGNELVELVQPSEGAPLVAIKVNGLDLEKGEGSDDKGTTADPALE